MDPREVASRLVALSAQGLPLLVGVECDQNRLRAALARPPVATPSGPYGVYPQQPGYPPPGYPSGPQPMQQYPPSNPFPVQTGPPSQPVPVPSQPGPGP